MKELSYKTDECSDCLYNISDYLWKSCYIVGDYRNMKITLNEQWQLAMKKYCDENSKTIHVNIIINELARSHYLVGSYESANYLIDMVYPVFKKELKLENSEMAKFLRYFADIKRSMKEYSNADVHYNEAKVLCEKVPNSGTEMALIIQSMAVSKSEQKKKGDADLLFESAQNYFSKNVIENYVLLGSLYENWAEHEISKGNFKAAGEKLEQRLSINKDVYGANHSFTEMIQKKIEKNNQSIQNIAGKEEK